MQSHIETSLPAEIMAHIFELGYEQANVDEEEDLFSDLLDSFSDDSDLDESKSKPDDVGSRHRGGLMFATTVSHVCCRWRQVALATPSLWSKLTFTTETSFEQNRTSLERSRNSPLELFLHFDMPDELIAESAASSDGDGDELLKKEVEMDLKRALDLIIPHVSRWRALHVMLDLDKHMDLLLGRMEPLPGAPLLQTLALCSNDFVSHPAYSKPYMLFSGSVPKLSDLSVDRACVDLSFLIPSRVRNQELSLSVLPSITNLTGLDLCNITIIGDVFVDVLRRSPKLCSLAVASSCISPLSLNAESRALLPDMEYLSLDAMSCTEAINLITCFYTPSLTGLNVTLEDEEDYSALFHEFAHSRPACLCSALLDEKDPGLGTNVDRELCTRSMLPTLTYLYHIVPTCQINDARLFLEYCTSLEVLTFGASSSSVAFIVALWDNAALLQAGFNEPDHSHDDTTPSEANRLLLCPQLRKLTIAYDTLGLEDFLRRRKGWGAEIRELALLRPPDLDVMSPVIIRLKQLVRNVTFENSETGHYEDGWYTTDDDTDDPTEFDGFSTGESD